MATVQTFVVFVSGLQVFGTVNANVLILAVGVCPARVLAVVPGITSLQVVLPLGAMGVGWGWQLH